MPEYSATDEPESLRGFWVYTYNRHLPELGNNTNSDHSLGSSLHIIRAKSPKREKGSYMKARLNLITLEFPIEVHRKKEGKLETSEVGQEYTYT